LSPVKPDEEGTENDTQPIEVLNYEQR